MKTFLEYAEAKGVDLSEMFPNLGQRAIPINGGGGSPKPAAAPGAAPGGAAGGPQKVSLSSLADRVSDPNWHQLYEVFTRLHGRHQGDPTVQQLGMALYKAAQSNDMNSLQPFVQKYLKAQKI